MTYDPLPLLLCETLQQGRSMTVYWLAGAAGFLIAIALWLLWRKWLWENIFGVMMVGQLSFDIPIVRVKIGDWVDMRMADGPDWRR